MSWNEKVARIRQLKIDLASLEPRLGPAIAPNPGSTRRGVSAVERKLHRRLPPSYRAFLLDHDGWPLFFEQASLLGTRELIQPQYSDLSRAAFESYETPIPEMGPSSRPQGRSDAMIPFGVCPTAAMLFAFNPAVVRPDGEMEVIAWMNGLGERYESFDEFLGFVGEMLELEVSEHARSLRRSA